ncbi:hypothetical protein ABK040_013321 [Willaertia magna]
MSNANNSASTNALSPTINTATLSSGSFVSFNNNTNNNLNNNITIGTSSVLYESFNLSGSTSLNKQTILYYQWHKKYPLLAIAKANGTVTVHDEHGEKIEKINFSRSTNCTCICWHPTKFFLVTGWKDGTLLIYNDKDSSSSKEIEEHGRITTMKWTPDGERLITCHQDGTIGVWKFEGNRIKLLINYDTNGSVIESSEQIVFNRDSNVEISWIFFVAIHKDEGSKVLVGVTDDLNTTLNNAKQQQQAIRLEHLHEVGIQFTASKISSLLFYREKSQLVILTDTALLCVYKINTNITKANETGVKQVMRTKISIANSTNSILKAMWVGNGIIATITCNENMIRIWNLDSDENSTLTCDPNEYFISFAFNPQKRAIVGGTNQGRMLFFVFNGNSRIRDQWEKYGEHQINSKLPIPSINWGCGEELLCYSTITSYVSQVDQQPIQDIEILQENSFQRKMKSNSVAVQVAFSSMLLSKINFGLNVVQIDRNPPKVIKTGLNIKNFDITESHLVVSNNNMIELYEVKGDVIRKLETFEIPSQCIGLHNESIFVSTNQADRIEVYSLKGVRKQTLQLNEDEGAPTSIDIQGDFITISTSNNIVRMWNVLGREAKPVSVPKKLFDNNQLNCEKIFISSIKCNGNGTMIGVLTKKQVEGEIDLLDTNTNIYIYDFEHDKLHSFNFNDKFKGGKPISLFWDQIEPTIFSVEIKTSEGESFVCTMFATYEHGILFQDDYKLEKNSVNLIGQCVPNLFFIRNNAQSDLIEKKSMKDFEGLEEVHLSPKTKKALLNFSFYLTIGSMEEAYKSVKLIESTSSIWHNMAKMCVKTRKMEIAEICLGNMKNALAARALRKMKEREPNELLAWIAILAIQLGMIEEAEKLYIECERYDLLNEMYQSIGLWEKAIETAKTKDRIHLKTTHYKYAKYLEIELGDLKSAQIHYELSNTHQYEVPRMYYNAGELTLLHTYILSHPDDKELNRWWANYCEGNTEYEEALKYYIIANDFLSQVRMYCFIGNLKMAADIVKRSQDKAAAYHFAKQLENERDNRKLLEHSIKYYKFSGCFQQAIRVAKMLGNDNEAHSLALQSNNEKLMIDVATYFENNNLIDKSVLLYQKGGNLSKAIDLCFKYQLFDTLSTIADNIFEDNSKIENDPEVFMKCSQFFIEHGQFERAVQMYIRGKEFELALETCLKKNVKLTEEMADQMVLPQDEEMNNNLLRKVAKVASLQGSYNIATKKYVQVGDKLKAMKVLIKSGDTEKIMLFAVLSRQKQLYILAANYLQSLDWHNEPEIIKSIISFYTKAKAWKFLSNFFENCSQIEIDEYRDYEKALDALKEAIKYLTKELKVKKSNSYETKLKQLNHKVYYIEKFILAKSLIGIAENESQFITICRELINNDNQNKEIDETGMDVDEAIRIGDVYAILIEYQLQTLDNPNEAYRLILEMKQKEITLNYFLDEEMIRTICKRVGVDDLIINENHQSNEDDIQEEIEDN